MKKTAAYKNNSLILPNKTLNPGDLISVGVGRKIALYIGASAKTLYDNMPIEASSNVEFEIDDSWHLSGEHPYECFENTGFALCTQIHYLDKITSE